MNANPNKDIIQGRWKKINIKFRKKITARYEKIKEI